MFSNHFMECIFHFNAYEGHSGNLIKHALFLFTWRNFQAEEEKCCSLKMMFHAHAMKWRGHLHFFFPQSIFHHSCSFPVLAANKLLYACQKFSQDLREHHHC